MAERRDRVLLGKRSSLSMRQRIYGLPDFLEVEELEGYDVTRRRVLLDEVLLVTYHQVFGWAFLAAMAALLTIFGFLSALIAIANVSGGLFVFALTGLPAAMALVLRLALRLDVVTVFGKRTKAEIHFWFRKSRARQVYREVCRRAKDRQDSLARDAARARRQVVGPPVSSSEPSA
jgi:hypothetical protein